MAMLLKKCFSVLDQIGAKCVGEKFNPFSRLGSLAVFCTILAVVTGVLLLPFYDVSVHHAYESVYRMVVLHRWSSGIIHGLHRYSSDAAVFFSIFHLLRVIAFKAFDKPRYLSWFTGALALGAIWVIGWLGFWLVWDQTGFLVAEVSAKMLDQIPIFAIPFVHGLFSNSSATNQVFFTVFFIHMILPLGLFVLLWIHVSRVNRPAFLVDRKNAIWLTSLLLILVIIFPPGLEAAADPFLISKNLLLDGYYLFAVPMIYRLSAGKAFVTLFLFSCVMLTLPLWLRKRKYQTSTVTPSQCVSCKACFNDCPYGAIEMRPREDGLPYKSVAWVDPSKCVGCGICNGACDTLGNNLPDLSTSLVRDMISLSVQKKKGLVFVCKEVFPTVNSDDLKDCLVVQVPCAGHINPGTIVHAFEKGVTKIFIASSEPGSCHYREGQKWFDERMSGHRKPKLKLSSRDQFRLKISYFGNHQYKGFIRQAQEFLNFKETV